MRWKGSKVGYLWTIDPSGTCAKAVCSINMEWDFKENCVAVFALHKYGKSNSQIFRLLKRLKISQNFIYQAIKRYKELWGVEDRARSGLLKSVRAEAAIKTVRERIRRNPLWKKKIMSRELNISTQSSRASSGTIYT
jgi:transposase